ncbi:hypothetical protein U1Q18_023763, partial [Sarracenia purpurea var. burkii]
CDAVEVVMAEKEAAREDVLDLVNIRRTLRVEGRGRMGMVRLIAGGLEEREEEAGVEAEGRRLGAVG